MEDTEHIYKFWRKLQTMLNFRGYHTQNSILSYRDFTAQVQHSDTRDIVQTEVHKQNNPQEILLIRWPKTRRVTVAVIGVILQELYKRQLPRALVIIRQIITNSAKQAIRDISSMFVIQYFTQEELLGLNQILQMSPKYVPLTEQEKEKFLQRFRIRAEQIPRMSSQESVVRYIGLVRGQMVKIINSQGPDEKFVTFRIIVQLRLLV